VPSYKISAVAALLFLCAGCGPQSLTPGRARGLLQGQVRGKPALASAGGIETAMRESIVDYREPPDPKVQRLDEDIRSWQRSTSFSMHDRDVVRSMLRAGMIEQRGTAKWYPAIRGQYTERLRNDGTLRLNFEIIPGTNLVLANGRFVSTNLYSGKPGPAVPAGAIGYMHSDGSVDLELTVAPLTARSGLYARADAGGISYLVDCAEIGRPCSVSRNALIAMAVKERTADPFAPHPAVFPTVGDELEGKAAAEQVEVRWYSYSFAPEARLALWKDNAGDQLAGGRFIIDRVTNIAFDGFSYARVRFRWHLTLDSIGRLIWGDSGPITGESTADFQRGGNGDWVLLTPPRARPLTFSWVPYQAGGPCFQLERVANCSWSAPATVKVR